MGINVNLAKSQATKLNAYSSELIGIRKNVITALNSLNVSWQSEEITHVNSAINSVISDLTKLASDIETLSKDISSSVDEVKKEEDVSALTAASK